MIAATVAVVALLVASPDTSYSAAALRRLALTESEAALVRAVGASPVTSRDALALVFAQAAATPDPSAELQAAHRLASAIARVTGDSFPLRQSARFARWSPGQRRIKVEIDSLRRAGNAAFSRDGFAVALPLWRESARRASSLPDTAGLAAALGNLGAGWYAEGAADSAAWYFTRAAELAEAAQDQRTRLNALGALANVHRDRGDLSGALAMYSETSRLRTSIGDERGLIADRINSAVLREELGDLDGAAEGYADALARSVVNGFTESANVSRLNLGQLAAMRGDFDVAFGHVEAARASYRAQGFQVEEASALRMLGLLEIRRGEYRNARRHLNAAQRLYQRTGPAASRAAVMVDLAALDVAAGQPDAARRWVDSAAAVARRSPDAGTLPGDVMLARADLEAAFNRSLASDRAYRQAEAIYRRQRDDAGVARARAGRGYLMLVDQDFARADDLLREAASLQDQIGESREAALTRLDLAAALSAWGRTDSALEVLQQAHDSLGGLGDVIGQAAAISLRADIAFERAQPAYAQSLYQAALMLLRGPEHAGLQAPLLLALARAQDAQGARAEARATLIRGITLVERGAEPLGPERRSAFLADKWALYSELARLEVLRGADSAAFAVSERMHARGLIDQLTRGSIAWRATPDSMMLRREQDLRRAITALAGTNAPGTGVVALRGTAATSSTDAARREALVEAEQRYGEVLSELRERAPAYAATVAPSIPVWRSVAALLPADAALVEYLVADSATVALVVTPGGVRAIPLVAERRSIVSLVDFVRGAMGAPPRRGAGSPELAPLRRLGQILVDPLEQSGALRGVRRLLIVPHAELHYLPFAALRDADGRYLVERYEIATAPSAGTWTDIEARGPASGRGVLLLAPATARLPSSLQEIRAAGAAWGDSAVALTGVRASKSELIRRASNANVVHVAGFGVLNRRNPLFSYVELAPTGSVDGRLEVHEVFGLGLDARLVVLSACETGVGSGLLGDVPPGDEWISLARAFLAAGARRVVASLWLIEDRATADLMSEFHRSLAAGSSPSSAMATAQRALIGRTGLEGPYYWAAFQVIGGF